MNKAPFLLVAIVIIAAFFLSCTKKPANQASTTTQNGFRTPSSAPVYTTPHGYKVEFEQSAASDKAPAPAPNQLLVPLEPAEKK